MYLRKSLGSGGLFMKNEKRCNSLRIFISCLVMICSLAGFVAASSYQLGTGDLLQISVWGHSELTTTVEVRPDGYITFPLVGDEYASGKTTSQLATDIQKNLSNYVVEPSVTVMVKDFRKINVQVLGEVRNPGQYTLRASNRLMDAVGLAGGPTRDANLSNITLTRIVSDETTILSLDLEQYIKEGLLNFNPILEDKDAIYISPVGDVLILGSIKAPGSYKVQADMDILDLMALCGGALDSGDLSQISLTRKTNGNQEEHVINLLNIMAGGKGSLKILPGDVLYIPEKQQVTVFGEVKSPGNYWLEPGRNLMELIGMAGGLSPLGDAGQVSIVRTVDGIQSLIKVDISPGMSGRVGGDNPVLFGGDVIYIPEANNTVLVLGEVRNPGSFTLKEQMTILDLLALSGDTTDKAALDRVTLTRHVADEIIVKEIDLALLKQTGIGRQTELLPGDVLFVPEGAPQAFVLGQIARPGAYRIHNDTKLLDLITMAGGALDKAGDQIFITRDGITSEISWRGLMRFGFGDQVIQPGDVVYVSEGKHQFLVLGEVRNPGYYQIDFEDRVLDGLAKAGGLLDTAATNISLTRQSQAENANFDIDLQRLMAQTFLPDNQLLEGGDVIIVPKAGQVMALGEVRNPGYFQFQAGQKMLDLVAMAGGATEIAATDEIQLVRWHGTDSETKVYSMNLAIEGENNENPSLRPGDVLVIPKRNREVLVLGEVARPGMYTIEENNRVLDLIGKAGGLSDKAEQTFSLTRQDGKTITIDYKDIIENNAMGNNIQMLGGDVIYVPEKNRRVLVFGEVGQPGAYLVDQYSTVLDVLALAGGPTDQAQLDEITLTTGADTIQDQVHILDLDAIISKEKPNLMLSGGEILHVPRSKQVLIMGEVIRPGSFTLARGMRILDILALAGGLRTNSDSQEIVLTRQTKGGEQVWLLSHNGLMKDQHENNHLLEGGDVIFVPELTRQVLVLGEVVNPGVYAIYENARVLDAIALAGGPKERAELGAIGIFRQGDPELASLLTLGKDKLLFQGDANENPLIQAGDIVYVPENRKPDWTSIFGFLGGIRTFQQIIDWFNPSR